MNGVSSLLLGWYAEHGRSHLPWRQTRDPYRILVSEFMLQQTQVERVLPKYEAFIERFPSLAAVSGASVAEILKFWKGLGYNSRAVRLHRVARAVIDQYGGEIPRQADRLRSLPGIGSYTVAAIRAFAFEEDEAALDTNIRRVVHRVLHGIEFPAALSPAELDAQARELLPAGKAHDWNSAMMDLGSQVCTARTPKCLLCPLRTVCEAAPIDAAELNRLRRGHSRRPGPQERLPFERTTRFARGRIVDALRNLPEGKRVSLLDLHAGLQPVLRRDAPEFGAIVQALAKDGLIEFDGVQVALAR